MTHQTNSFVGSIASSASNLLTVDHTKDPLSTKFTKLSVGMVAFAGVALLGSIETVVRGALALVAQLISALLPGTLSETFTTQITTPLTQSTQDAATATLQTASKIVNNFFKPEE